MKIIFKDEKGEIVETKEASEQLSKNKEIFMTFISKENFSMIPQELINKKWEEIKLRLGRENYIVKHIKQPEILGFVLAQDDFDELTKQLFYISTIDFEEYGKPFNPEKEKASASIKDISGNGTKWLLCVCKSRKSLDYELNHELKHIFEYFLKLGWGKL